MHAQLRYWYDELASGDTTRGAAADWARSIDSRAVSFSDAPDPALCYEALYSLRAATTRGESVLTIDHSSSGPPFFVRDRDILEWRRLLHAALDPREAVLQENVATLSGVVGNDSLPSTLRGVDGLDYFEQWDVTTPTGRLAVLQHHAGTPADQTVAHLDLVGRSAPEAVAEIIQTLNLSDDAVTWRSSRFF